MPAAASCFDFDAYLGRIGLTGRPTPAQLLRAHVTSIPFENLDPLRGVAPVLELGALQRKIVHERRGGYCFEQNLLLAAALRELGCEVELLLARVWRGRTEVASRPRSHLCLRMRDATGEWLADAGFSGRSLLAPIPFAPGSEHEQDGWRYRIVERGRERLLQCRGGGEWEDLYGFIPEPVPLIDIDTSNWFTATYPGSIFTTGLLVTKHADGGQRLSLSDWSGELCLTRELPAELRVAAVKLADVPRLLAEHFALPGVVLSGRGVLVPGSVDL